MNNKVVILKDNGLRCFVPPCFSWDILDSISKAKITAASELDLSRLQLKVEEEDRLRNLLSKGELQVKGYTALVQASEPTNQEGLSFIVIEVVAKNPSLTDN